MRQEVAECYHKLSQFYKNVLYPKKEFSPDNFLKSGFAWKKVSQPSKSIVKMFHGERIVNSHIGYLDSLRFYCFKLVDITSGNGYLDVNLDILRLLKCVMTIRGFKASIPTISKFYRSDAESFLILSGGIVDESTGRMVCGKQKIVVFHKDGHKTNGDVPLEEVVICLKAAFNFIIVDAIKKYIRMFNAERSSDSLATSDNIYLISCYLACIHENIEKTDILSLILLFVGKQAKRLSSSK